MDRSLSSNAMQDNRTTILNMPRESALGMLPNKTEPPQIDAQVFNGCVNIKAEVLSSSWDIVRPRPESTCSAACSSDSESTSNQTFHATVRKTISINKSAILSLKNCLKRIGKTRKSDEDEKNQQVFGSNVNVEIGPKHENVSPTESAARSETQYVKIEPENRVVQSNKCEASPNECTTPLNQRIRPMPKRKLPTSGPMLEPQIRSSLLQKYRKKSPLQNTQNDCPPPFSTEIIERFLEKAWLSYTIVSGDQLIFPSPGISYSLTAASIPSNPPLRVVSHNSAEAASQASVTPSEIKLRLKRQKLREEAEKTQAKQPDLVQACSANTPPPEAQADDIMVSSAWADAEFFDETTIMSSPSISPRTANRAGPSNAKDPASHRSRKPAGMEVLEFDDPYSVSVGTAVDLEPALRCESPSGASAAPLIGDEESLLKSSLAAPLKKNGCRNVIDLAMEAQQELQWLCHVCGINLEMDSPIVEIIEEVQSSMAKFEDTLWSQKEEAGALIQHQKKLLRQFCCQRRIKYMREFKLQKS